jgi:hypothetical protein
VSSAPLAGSGEQRAKTARRFRAQAAACRFLGSAVYAHLLACAADDIEKTGPVWELLAPYAEDPGGSMLALRLMGATHRLALSGADPALAARYPSTGGDGDTDGAWQAWLGLVRDRADEVFPLVSRGVQTNEVGRAATLLGGFLAVARQTGLPLRVLEVGTSAGLNLRWDHFRYRVGAATWGPPGSPVDLGNPFEGPVVPSLTPPGASVAERRGCDPHPLDPTDAEDRLTLLSYVWPDQTTRFANLAGACDVAAGVPVTIDRESGDSWIAGQLAAAVAGLATVVFHSVMLQYVEPSARRQLLSNISAAGRRATEEAPVAWLRFEPAGHLASVMEVRLTQWPGGVDHRLAVAHPHGAWVRWEAP